MTIPKRNLSSFNAPEVELSFAADEDLKKDILKRSEKYDIPVVRSGEINITRYGFREELDHGVMVPMYFINKFTSNFKLLPIAFGMLPYEDLYSFGKLIKESAEALNKRVIVIASGDFSHKLTPDAPAGYTPQGKVFDEKLVAILRDFDIAALSNLDSRLIERAGECGLRSIWIMAGALDGYNVKSEVYSYEGPFGVGYCVARFDPESKGKSRVEDLYKNRQNKIENRRGKEDSYVKLARYTLESYVKEGKVPPLPENLPEEMIRSKAGVFVSIKVNGELRGCIGTFLPTQKNIAEEIRRNAISAGCEDPRFYPVRPYELSELEYSVDVLSKPEPVKSIEKLDPKKYGVIVRQGYKSGLLLPDLEGVDTVEEQLNIALRKAGISPNEKYEIERFEVIRHL